jgi:signal transduction histidine kinase
VTGLETDGAPARAELSPRAVSARYAVSLTATACLALTVLLSAFPELVPVYGNRSLHVALETIAALVLLLVASVLAGRYRRTASGRDLLALLAVGVLAVNNLFLSVLTTVVTDHPSAFTTWASHGTYVLGPILLVAAALTPSKPLRRRRRTELLLTVGTVALLGAIVVVTAAFAGELPGQFASPPTDRESLELFHQQPILTVLESFAALCFAVAAAALAYHADRERDAFQMWLALFAMIASVAFVNYALFPTLYTELIYAGDIFLLLADLALLIGTTREIATYQDAVTQAAVLEERRRLARDLHDGVAQELAFIASQLRWTDGAGSHDGGEPDQILESVERALDESRGAIAALSRPVHEPLHVALAQTAEDVVERLGGRLKLDLQESVEVPPPWRQALARILREAVANAIRHGHARTISVELRDGDRIVLRVSDDGDGFDPSEPHPATRFGLISMRERTESLGGEFRLSSRPGEGTSVEVLIP